MPSDNQGSSTKMIWAGRVVSALPVLMLVFSATMKFIRSPEVVDGFTHLGYQPNVILPLGIVELACTVLYIIPQTSVLGAILLSAYLGGATATHFRVGEPYFAPIITGVFVWFGLFLRDARIRALVPLRG
jgi:hypothetical protein